MIVSRLLRVKFTNYQAIAVSTQRSYGTNLSTKHIDEDDKMQAWQIHSYGGLNDLKLSNVSRIPVIEKPNEVSIKISASSVNPIDVAMTKGYGSTTFNLMRKKNCSWSSALKNDTDIEFPLTLGRDFSGIVVSKGHNVGDRLKLGDHVWGVVPIDRQGCHANYVVVDDKLVNSQPDNISYVEASSILYAGLTAWSALWITGGLSLKSIVPATRNTNVLVLGGSGGVGTIAIQMLKVWKAHVTTTCSTDAVDTLTNLGADNVIDYKENDADNKVFNHGPYDIILDCCGQGIDKIKEKGYPYRTYITLNSPLLRNVDNHGFLGGSIKNLGDLIKSNIPSKYNENSTVKWGFFAPSQTGIKIIQNMVESRQIVPIVQQVYPFEELPNAYERVSEGHLRGKVVIDMKKH